MGVNLLHIHNNCVIHCKALGPHDLKSKSLNLKDISGQITIIPKPECFGDLGGDSLTKPPFKVTKRREQVAIICPDISTTKVSRNFNQLI